MPRILGIHETVLYADDVAVLASFYENVLGLTRVDPPDDDSAGFRLDDGNVLLMFDPGRTTAGGRFVPPHGATGAGHIAFKVADLDAALRELSDKQVDIEREIGWPKGGRSVYFRDPAGNSVELVEGEIW